MALKVWQTLTDTCAGIAVAVETNIARIGHATRRKVNVSVCTSVAFRVIRSAESKARVAHANELCAALDPVHVWRAIRNDAIDVICRDSERLIRGRVEE